MRNFKLVSSAPVIWDITGWQTGRDMLYFLQAPNTNKNSHYNVLKLLLNIVNIKYPISRVYQGIQSPNLTSPRPHSLEYAKLKKARVSVYVVIHLGQWTDIGWNPENDILGNTLIMLFSLVMFSDFYCWFPLLVFLHLPFPALLHTLFQSSHI